MNIRDNLIKMHSNIVLKKKQLHNALQIQIVQSYLGCRGTPIFLIQVFYNFCLLRGMCELYRSHTGLHKIIHQNSYNSQSNSSMNCLRAFFDLFSSSTVISMLFANLNKFIYSALATQRTGYITVCGWQFLCFGSVVFVHFFL